MTLTSPDGTLPSEMIKKFADAGFRFAEVPVHHYHRAYGHSQFFNPRRLLRVVREVLRLWWKLVVRPVRDDGTRPKSDAPDATGPGS